MTTTTHETTRDGYDLVMTSERDGWTASIYRTGKQVPLRRTMVATEEKARAWFGRFLASVGAAS